MCLFSNINLTSLALLFWFLPCTPMTYIPPVWSLIMEFYQLYFSSNKNFFVPQICAPLCLLKFEATISSSHLKYSFNANIGGSYLGQSSKVSILVLTCAPLVNLSRASLIGWGSIPQLVRSLVQQPHLHKILIFSILPK